MPCSSCGNTSPLVFDVQSFLNPECNSCGDVQCYPAKNVCYTGPNLVCSGILTNDDLETAFTKIDEQICSASGDYSTYQKNCLPAWAGNDLNTEALFVEAITGYACETRENLDEFIQSTFPDYQVVVDERFDDIELPAITCASAGIVNTDTLSTVYTKYCTKFTQIDDALNISDVDFASCFTVTTAPTTVKTGFEELIAQICTLQGLIGSGGVVLPTFNNVGTCLGGTLTTTDSTESTIIKIRTKLCTLPTWDKTGVTWGCVGVPTPNTLEAAFQNVITKVNYMLPKTVTFGSGFSVVPTDVSNPCLGVTVTPTTSADRFVASNGADSSPGTLKDKLLGTGITIDDATTAGKITLISDYKVKADVSDVSPNFLINKLNGSSVSGITITPTYNSLTKKVDLVLSIDPDAICSLLSGCSTAVPCTTYIVTPAGTSSLSYTDCSGSIVSISISGVTEICAKLNTVYAPNATIVNDGACATGCYAPVTLTSSAITSSSFVETWSAVTGATEYQYRLNGGSWISNALALTVTVSASPSTTYTFDVRAIVDGISCSEFTSNAVTTEDAISTPNVYIQNNPGFGITINDVDLSTSVPFFAFSSGSFPLVSGVVTGVHTGFTGIIRLTVATGASTGTAKLYVDSVLIECIDLTVGTANNFTTNTYLSSEEISVIVEAGTCGV